MCNVVRNLHSLLLRTAHDHFPSVNVLQQKLRLSLLPEMGDGLFLFFLMAYCLHPA